MDDRQQSWFRARSVAFQNLRTEVFEELVADLANIYAVSDKPSASAKVREISVRHQLAAGDVASAIAWISVAANTYALKGEEAALAELEAAFDPDLNKEVVRGRLKQVFGAAEQIKPNLIEFASRVTAGRGLLPAYEDLDATVELRAVMSGLKNMGQLSDADAKIVGLEPIASFQLVLDSGFPPVLNFQATRGDILNMAAVLGEAIRRMDELAQYARGDQ